MKKLLSFLVCLMLGALPGLAYETDDYYAYSYARMSYVNGDVFIQRAGDMGHEEGTVNLPIVENDKLGTQDGRAEVHFGNKNYLRIDRYTQIDLAALPKQGNDSINIHLLSGNIYLRVSHLEREKAFEIHTPDASYYILDVGLYRFSVQENQQTELRVLEGAAEAAGEEGSILVEANEAVLAANGLFTSGPGASYASYEDDFSGWNKTRDAAITRYTANNYLPEELNDYEYELSYHGRWVYEQPYGHVWVPNVYDVGWRPYWNGRWIWYPIIGWTWVSYEPWGWCVSHYGRWHWRMGLGWYWIPTAHWGPAWVHWYHGYDYYGWCPLSYYNRPVVIVNNHFYGNYHSDHYPVNSRALTVVHKSQLQNRQVAKVALSSSSVSRLGKISLTNKQPTLNPVFDKTSLSNSKAAKVLARSDVREVSRSFSKSTAISSRSGSLRIKDQGLSRSSSSQIRNTPSGTNPAGSSGSSRIIQRDSSSSSSLTGRSSSSAQVSNESQSFSRTPIKTYPSSSQSSSSIRSIQPGNKSYGINSRSASSSSKSSSIRSYPSSRSTVSPPSRSEVNTSRYSSRLSSTPSRTTIRQSTGSSSDHSSDRSLSSHSYSSRSSDVSRYPSRSTSSSYSSSGSSSYYSPTSRSSAYSSHSSSRYTSPSSNYTGRSSSSYSSGSRITYSSPSRSSSSSSYSSPSRSYSSSGSSSSRYTSPARSSSSSSRSSVSSSRSHGSSSISRSSSSRSSSHSSSSSRRKK